MRKITWIAMCALAFGVAVGCSDDDTDTGNTPAPETGVNGKKISEDKACETLVDALEAQADKLGCTLETLACPDYIRTGAAEDCSLYDQGRVNTCVDFFKTYSSCDDFGTKPCTLTVYPNPDGCEGSECDKDEEGNCLPECDKDEEGNCIDTEPACDPEEDEDCVPEDDACDPAFSTCEE